MKCHVLLQCLIVGSSLLLNSGCSLSRGSQISRAAESGENLADESANEDAPVKTASADNAPADGDAPPSQPGVKAPGGSRKKLTGWLSKSKSNTIPLDRTDKSKTADSEPAEEDSGWWKHQDVPATASNSASEKTKDSESLSLSSTNPFDR